MERGCPEVSPKLNQDAEDVPKRKPLASPVPASIPKVDHVDVARKGFARSAVVCLEPEHFGERECLDPPVPSISGGIGRSL
jgi:hypothetical protein